MIKHENPNPDEHENPDGHQSSNPIKKSPSI
jgi:hypothetical protein